MASLDCCIRQTVGVMLLRNLLYAYSSIKICDEILQDYFEFYNQFIIYVLKESTEGFDLATISEKIKSDFGFLLPVHIVRLILEKLDSENLVQKIGNKYILNPDMSIEVNDICNSIGAKNDVDSLVGDILKFFKKNNKKIKDDDLDDSIIRFIHKSIDPIISSVDEPNTIDGEKLDPENERILCNYVRDVSKDENEYYKIFLKIFLGAIACSAFKYADFSEYNKDMKKCKIYLDTNIVFSLLNLQYPEFNGPINELFDLIKKSGLPVKVFDFTIEELRNYLVSCSRQPDIYPSSIKINSVCSYIKKEQKMSTEHIKYLAGNIEQRLKELGLEVERTGIILRFYKSNSEIVPLLRKYKTFQPTYAQHHDLAAIDAIKKLRKNKEVGKIEDASALFLTSDGKLSKYNFESYHKYQGTIPETIVDRLLAGILWLKNPKYVIKLTSLVSACSRDVFISERAWTKFVQVAADVKNEFDSERDLKTLWYHEYIEEVLSSVDDDDVEEKINADFILNNINNSKAFYDKQFKEELDSIVRGFVWEVRLLFTGLNILNLIILYMLNSNNILAYISILIMICISIANISYVNNYWEFLVKRMFLHNNYKNK